MPDIPEKIHIIGGPASGKTYLASQMADQLEYPHVELDTLYWDSSFSTRNTPEERQRLLAEAVEGPQWVIEGAYCGEWVRPALDAADVIVSLRMSLLLQRSRAALRLSRRAMVGNTTLAQSRSLLAWINGFEQQYSDEFPHNEYDSKTVTLLSRAAVNTYIQSVVRA